jgi:hypothetical protein
MTAGRFWAGGVPVEVKFAFRSRSCSAYDEEGKGSPLYKQAHFDHHLKRSRPEDFL